MWGQGVRRAENNKETGDRLRQDPQSRCKGRRQTEAASNPRGTGIGGLKKIIYISDCDPPKIMSRQAGKLGYVKMAGYGKMIPPV